MVCAMVRTASRSRVNSGPNATTPLGGYRSTVFPRGAHQSDNNLAVTFIHETFHLGPGAKTDQQMWQAGAAPLSVSRVRV